jgi:hypothetical protein
MSSYSPDLRIELIDSGAQAGTWGTTTNNTFAYLLEAAIAGYQTVSVTSASQALTHINGASATAGDNQSVYAMLRFTTTTGAAFSVYAPPVSKQYIVYNNSGYAMTIYNSTVIGNTTAAGAGITVANGAKVMVWSDGTNFNELQAQNLTGTLAIANGGTGQTTANTAFNALAPSQGSASGKYLKSDGTNTSWDQIDVGSADITGTLAVANGGTGVSTLTALGNLFYPVGSIYSSTVSTNPGTLLGFGTWTAFAAGRTLIGNGGGFSAGATGGSNDAIVVSHTHTTSDPGAIVSGTVNVDTGSSSGLFGSTSGDFSLSNGNNEFVSGGGTAPGTRYLGLSISGGEHTHTISTTGSSGTNANLPPYIVVYMWQRTA